MNLKRAALTTLVAGAAVTGSYLVAKEAGWLGRPQAAYSLCPQGPSAPTFGIDSIPGAQTVGTCGYIISRSR
jgi:hypothetical protein